jgi:alpha/beta superfamily hydrolase
VPELIRPSSILPANRRSITLRTADNLTLVGEVAAPIGERTATLLCLHPNPTGGGMMDSHIYKKASNRLPAMAGIEVIRFNTRGTESAAGKSEGSYDNGGLEKLDVEAAIHFALDDCHAENLWVVGWSFGTDLALRHARDPRVKGLILLSPPLMTAQESDLEWWAEDGRPVTALIPEFDDYLKPDEAKVRFEKLKQIELINIADGKHLWVGEPAVHRVLSEITKILAPAKLPLPTEWEFSA